MKNEVKNIQTAGYNGARTVHRIPLDCQKPTQFPNLPVPMPLDQNEITI